MQWKLLQFSNLGLKVEMDICEFWHTVYSYKNGVEESCFEELVDFVFNLLVLPHSSAAAERKFSQLNLIKTKYRNKLETQTINSIMQAKDLCKNDSNDLHYVWSPKGEEQELPQEVNNPHPLPLTTSPCTSAKVAFKLHIACPSSQITEYARWQLSSLSAMPQTSSLKRQFLTIWSNPRQRLQDASSQPSKTTLTAPLVGFQGADTKRQLRVNALDHDSMAQFLAHGDLQASIRCNLFPLSHGVLITAPPPAGATEAIAEAAN
ncbi:hypothetical protein FF38_13866 [Lucilia cuprina]|uniref:HAT C-terminal dimerisation domain-containing protein n=1 Tax=Lucilia cuprina TaxID=7375 RepID=A0A0L0CQU5_LUCCU|nr:hypothetical protein FF38_13866 [Lucilia cuprina]